jgi:uncharacterized protein DUF4440
VDGSPALTYPARTILRRITVASPSRPFARPSRIAVSLLALLGAVIPGSGFAQPEAAVEETGVRQLLDAWLKAQNSGDFPAYRALYSSRFFGIKRSGPRTYSFDAASWLRDRERMFRKKMSVEASDVAIARSSRSAVVRFTQKWSSGTYSDTGAKQLVVVHEGAGLRIAREEMLHSRLDAAGQEARPLDPADLAMVLDLAPADGGPYVVLRTDAQESWAGAERHLVSDGVPVVVSSPAAPAALPAGLADWRGRRLALYGAKGKSCSGAVAELVVLTRVAPHFGTRQEWEGTAPEDGAEHPPVAEADRKARIAREAWDLGAEGRLLVGRIQPEGGAACGEALYARAEDRPAPALYAVQAVPAELEALARRRFRELAGYKAIDEMFREWAASAELKSKPEHWDELGGEATEEPVETELRLFRDEASGRTLLAMGARGGPGCGGFSGAFWALWEVGSADGGEPRLVLLSDEKEPGDYFMPQAALDADGDGQPELVGAESLLRLAGSRYRRTEEAKYPDFDCPC